MVDRGLEADIAELSSMAQPIMPTIQRAELKLLDSMSALLKLILDQLELRSAWIKSHRWQTLLIINMSLAVQDEMRDYKRMWFQLKMR